MYDKFSLSQNVAKHKDCFRNPDDIEHVSSTVVKSEIDAYYKYPSNGYTLPNRAVLREFGMALRNVLHLFNGDRIAKQIGTKTL